MSMRGPLTLFAALVASLALARPAAAETKSAPLPEIVRLEAELEEQPSAAHRRDVLAAAAADPAADDQVRAWALERLVDTLAGGDGPAELLLTLAAEDDRGMRAAVQRAYWQLIVRRAGAAGDAYLIEAAAGRLPSTRSGTVRRWAARELCRRGVGGAWAVIESALGARSARAAQALALCRRQIAALEDCGRPLDGLLDVLSRPDTLPRAPLHRWALETLAAMETAESRAHLVAYGLRVQRADWSRGRQIADLLRRHGMSDAELAAHGFDPVPPAFRIGADRRPHS